MRRKQKAPVGEATPAGVAEEIMTVTGIPAKYCYNGNCELIASLLLYVFERARED